MSWPQRKLGEVILDMKDGGTPTRKRPDYFGGDVNWCVVKDIKPHIHSTLERLTTAGLNNSSAKVWPIDSVIISLGATIGQVGIAKVPTATKQGLSGIVVNKNVITPEYLVYVLNDRREFIQGLASGTTIKEVRPPKLQEALSFPVPPLPEQQRIVGKLDAAFAALTEAQAHVERNRANAQELFESYLNGVFEGKGEGWVDTRLEEVCGFQNGFAFKSNTFREQGIPVLRISNIQDGQVDTDKIVFVDPKDYREDLSRYRIGEGDLVIAMSGATTGKIGFNTQPTVFLLNQRVGKFEPTSKLNKRFLYYFLSTKVEENLSISAGSAQPNLSTEQIKSFELPLPSIQEQEKIVAELDSLHERTHELETTYQQKLTELAGLKKAVLGAAFRGEL